MRKFLSAGMIMFRLELFCLMMMTGGDEFTYSRGQLLDQRHPDPNTIESDRLPWSHTWLRDHRWRAERVEVVCSGRASGIGAESLLQFSR